MHFPSPGLSIDTPPSLSPHSLSPSRCRPPISKPPKSPPPPSRRLTLRHGNPIMSGGATDPDDFPIAVARVAAAQIASSAGFASARRSALDSLASLALRYISDLARAATFHAALSSRTHCTVFDVAQALRDLGSAAPLSSLARYVTSSSELPFPVPLPRFPARQGLRSPPTFAHMGETPIGDHVPDWLPALPDRHTYLHTPVWNGRTADPRAEKVEQARQRRKAEKSLLGLQKRIAGGKLADAEERFPVLETFAAAIDAARNTPLVSGVGEGRVSLSRTKVLFRFGVDKKSVAVPLAALGVRTGVLFLRDDEKDDKKRRAEMILKEAMENPEELIQL